MATNTYKKTTKRNTNSPTATGEKAKSFKFNLFFYRDPRFKLSVGLFLLGFSVFLFLSFLSYLFTGQADQANFDALGTNGYSSKEVDNWIGQLGMSLSHKFMFDWFGLSSFAFIPVLFMFGYKLVYKKELNFLLRYIKGSVFFLLYFSFVLGYLTLISTDNIAFHYICGGFGYFFADILNDFMGWGTALFSLFILSIFVIFFFDVTSLNDLLKPSQRKKKEIIPQINEDEDNEEDDLIEEEEEEDSEYKKRSITVEIENEEEDIDLLPGESEEFVLSNRQPQKKNSTDQLSLDIENVNTKEEKLVSSYEKDDSDDFEIHESVVEAFADQVENYDPTLDLSSYKYPTLDLLENRSGSKVQVTREELEQNKDKIVDTLGHYKIGISSIKATIGPTVTLYEIIPEPGVKISKIKNLEDDIALSLAALGIRIIAPIPGKGTIGIEVPNKNRELVSSYSLFATEKFMKSDMELPIIFGKTISNETFIVDLAKMPHILMAGATGQGKSVGLNILLNSLLYKKHPSQLKLVLVDPKKVELSIFSKIEKHFLAKLPDEEEAIITDTSKVINTLNSLCMEMDQRYDLLKDAGCRNIKEYNYKFIHRKLNPEKGHRYLPYIVLVIDELADLMMTAGKEVETPIARLAQLARAIGIHLVVATQRPSVNVITGIIKANFPARISFKVTSKIDSRTILDTGGADQLVGMGDMLFTQGSEIVRLQCGFIDTHEVEAICDFIGDQKGYSSAFILPEFIDENSSGQTVGGVDMSDRDVMFEDAARIIVLHQQGSTSLVQRKLKLGYNRAGRIIDQLEAAGIVGKFEGSKARDVLIHDEYALEQLLSNL